MPESIKQWIFDPTIGKLLSAVVGVAVVWTVGRLLRKSVEHYVEDNAMRYRVRKVVSLLVYVASAMVLATVFSTRLAGFTVAFGVAGAGIAFALQEVIASVAGWVAISFGNFFKTGDRVQVGGIKGDVIDIGVLRTTALEEVDVSGDKIRLASATFELVNLPKLDISFGDAKGVVASTYVP